MTVVKATKTPPMKLKIAELEQKIFNLNTSLELERQDYSVLESELLKSTLEIAMLNTEITRLYSLNKALTFSLTEALIPESTFTAFVKRLVGLK